MTSYRGTKFNTDEVLASIFKMFPEIGIIKKHSTGYSGTFLGA